MKTIETIAIWGVGKNAEWVHSEVITKSDIQIKCFIDGTERKKRAEFRDIDVISPDEIKCIQGLDLIIVAVATNTLLEEILLLIRQKQIQIPVWIFRLWTLEKKLNFIDDGILKENCFFSVDFDEPPIIHLETQVVDNCNFRCKACGNFSPFVKGEEMMDIVDFKKSVQILKSKFSNIFRFFFLGGEPLLAPDLLVSAIQIMRNAFPDTEIRVITNASLLKRISEPFWNELKENHVIIQISLYPIMRKQISDIEFDLKKKGITYSIIEIEKFDKWLMTDSIDVEDKEILYKCSSAGCHHLYKGKVYRCPQARTIMYYDKEKNTEYYSNDFQELSKHLNSWEFLDNLTKKINLCHFCSLERQQIEWGQEKCVPDVRNWFIDK